MIFLLCQMVEHLLCRLFEAIDGGYEQQKSRCRRRCCWVVREQKCV